ncbi:MAG: hypothetical protein FJ304_21995, partial [Planctomycetes bacterium]|nr:hypothetical protein [Planctomycetota bacterium]
MPALFVPTFDALRLALASGLVPGAAARAPGRAGRDTNGHLWLEPDEMPARDALAALARLGVVALGSPGVPTEPVRCWADLLPLRRAAPAPGPLLFNVPDRHLAALVARLRRDGAPVGVRLLPDPHAGRAWATCAAPSPSVVGRAEEPDSGARVFYQQAPHVWVARGWEHPLASHLVAPPDGVLLVAGEGTALVPGFVPEPHADDFALAPRPVAPVVPVAAPPFEVRFRLKRTDAPHEERLWVLGPAEAPAFDEFCRTADERLLRRFEYAPVSAGADSCVVVRRATAADGAAVLPVLAPGFAPDPRLAGLFVPTGFALRPHARTHELAAALGLATGRVVWVTGAPGGVTAHGTDARAFRPLHERIEYAAPPAARLTPDAVPEELFPFARVALQQETTIDLEPEAAPAPPPRDPGPVAPVADAPRGPGWVARLAGWLRGRR